MDGLARLNCGYFEAGVCRSCTLLPIPVDRQRSDKQSRVSSRLPMVGSWEPLVGGPESGFRNKAKMVAGGTIAEPTLGILSEDLVGVDLRDCGLYVPAIHAALPTLAEFVTVAGLPPYDVKERRGELKHVIVTANPAGELMVRWVLRSREPLARIEKHLTWLLERLPIVVASVNLQPEHKAVLEGPIEIVLHGDRLPMPVAGLPLSLQPQSFFQTNTAIAAGLYEQATSWTRDLRPLSAWDLYSGVGGFAFAVAGAVPGVGVTGVETSAEAVAAAASAGVAGTTFVADDATSWAVRQPAAADLVVVNPPRRGIGSDLATWLNRAGGASIIYSSCNPESLARDLGVLTSYDVVAGRVFDMFPQTDHVEVMVRLERIHGI